MRTLKEIEDDMDHYGALGEIGTVMDLVDEHGNTIDKMYEAIMEGDLERALELEKLGMDITENHFVKAAILHDQLLVVAHQVNNGADVELVIDFAKPREEPLIEGNISFSGGQAIWQWARCWQSVNALSEKLPPKGQVDKKTKI
ncbi:hypothetical protein [Burkholderia cenocepacia]|uniref:hypothetical protein n=1 Tax=Burkholderia cenocepacia TaxID=95486 RepID=UPI001589AED9|nr:hypothetical protein [Burkholderia cenocepacia]